MAGTGTSPVHICAQHLRYVSDILGKCLNMHLRNIAQLPFEEAWCMRLANTDFTHADQAAAACTYPCDVLSLFA